MFRPVLPHEQIHAGLDGIVVGSAGRGIFLGLDALVLTVYRKRAGPPRMAGM